MEKNLFTESSTRWGSAWSVGLLRAFYLLRFALCLQKNSQHRCKTQAALSSILCINLLTMPRHRQPAFSFTPVDPQTPGLGFNPKSEAPWCVCPPEKPYFPLAAELDRISNERRRDAVLEAVQEVGVQRGPVSLQAKTDRYPLVTKCLPAVLSVRSSAQNPVGYSWSYLACTIGHSVPIRDSCTPDT
jgi:hypothetical protein